MMAAVSVNTPGQNGLTRQSEDGQRKLPRPIVFWSLNEKTAYRRNRVVQTRLNMVMDDIKSQRETSRKTIRYEAHKFRQKSGRYYCHPMSASGESSANIAPPNWRHPNDEAPSVPAQKKSRSKLHESDSEADYDEEDDDDDDDIDGKGMKDKRVSPRKSGIITRAKKPSVKFSMYKKVHAIENDIKVDDLDIADDRSETTSSLGNHHNLQFRSQSALQCREIPDLPGQPTKRQQSALPSLRSAATETNGNNRQSPGAHERFKVVIQDLRSDTFFDKSKAAYQLRQDLKRRAKMRKQGVKTSVFTLQDAIKLEREKYMKSSNKVVDYMKRIEATKLAESLIVNKWTRGDFESQLNL